MAKPIGYAVLGLGDLTQRAALPAFARAADNSRLVAVVTSDRTRAQTLAQEFRVTGYHYDELRQCLQRDDVNAVYIVLPAAMHCDYAVEAARAGVHVLCDRPMAVMADECRRMIRTCQTNRVKLMVSYRLHSQPAFRKAVELVFGVRVRDVRTMVVRGDLRRVGKFTGKQRSWKKAIVTVHPGDSIDLYGDQADKG